MPVQVSYKKQFVFLFLLTLTFLAVVEVGVNVWLYYFYRCEFENNEIFENVDTETKRKICLENLGYSSRIQTVSAEKGTRLDGGLDEKVVYINSDGFRGPEITKAKPLNTYRIFVVGGSTTFGAGSLDHQTPPFYLEEFYNQTNLDVNVEVINAGWPFRWSLPETTMIKENLLDYEPDLFIVYDGVNELIWQRKGHSNASPTQWMERWMETCDLGNKQGFDTIITLQPMISTGKKILTQQEVEQRLRLERGDMAKNYPVYIEQLNELKNHCTLTADLRGIFDHLEEPLYWDWAHTGPKGNQIIAENLYQLSLPTVMKQSKNIVQNKDGQVSDATLEIKDQVDSKNFDFYSEQFFYFINDIISPYKTPKVFSLIPSNFASEQVYTISDNVLDADTLNNEARKLIGSRNYQEAIDLLDKALEINPNFIDVLYNKGWAFVGLGKQEEAIVWLDKALVLNPNHAHAMNMKGNALLGLKPEEAIVWYDKALEVNPKYVFALNNKGLALSNLGRYDEAISSYEKALEINPNYKAAQQNKILAQQNTELSQQKIEFFKDVRLSVHALNNKGYGLYKLEQYEEAITYFDKALEINPNYNLARINKNLAENPPIHDFVFEGFQLLILIPIFFGIYLKVFSKV